MRALLILLLGLGACTQERVVYYRPALSTLPGAVSNTPVAGELPGTVALEQVEAKDEIEHADGSRTLVIRSGRQLMRQIWRLLEADERDLFVKEVMSEPLREEFRLRSRDPGEAFDILRARKDDLYKLFRAMPNGEYTPGVIMQKVGDKTYRVEVSGKAASGLRWTGFDMIMERGHWRLGWFG
ncbi:MAG: hypothetical protein KDA28_01965 [Phycisphaerales bacterium]|nr:hypothetical protein [Phycisphaerales bacterium]